VVVVTEVVVAVVLIAGITIINLADTEFRTALMNQGSFFLTIFFNSDSSIAWKGIRQWASGIGGAAVKIREHCYYDIGLCIS
jgi:hypothetical protein